MLVGIHFCSYYLFLRSPIKFKLFLLFAFLVVSFTLRVYYAPTEFADFENYNRVIANDFFVYDFPLLLISEPYLAILSKILSLVFDETETVVSGIFWLNFVLVSTFFTWLGLRKDIQVFSKIALFSLYYYFWGFVLLRNSWGYILFALLVITPSVKTKISFLLSSLAHLSVLPIFVSIFKSLNPFIRIRGNTFILISLIYLSAFILVYLTKVFFGYFDQNLVGRLISYLTSEPKYSFPHVALFISINLFFLKELSGSVRHKFSPELLFLLYVSSFFINPVISSRFSVYLILYKLMDPNFELRLFNLGVKSNSKFLVSLFTFFLLLSLSIYSFFNVKV